MTMINTAHQNSMMINRPHFIAPRPLFQRPVAALYEVLGPYPSLLLIQARAFICRYIRDMRVLHFCYRTDSVLAQKQKKGGIYVPMHVYIHENMSMYVYSCANGLRTRDYCSKWGSGNVEPRSLSTLRIVALVFVLTRHCLWAVNPSDLCFLTDSFVVENATCSCSGEGWAALCVKSGFAPITASRFETAIQFCVWMGGGGVGRVVPPPRVQRTLPWERPHNGTSAAAKARQALYPHHTCGNNCCRNLTVKTVMLNGSRYPLMFK